MDHHLLLPPPPHHPTNQKKTSPTKQTKSDEKSNLLTVSLIESYPSKDTLYASTFCNGIDWDHVQHHFKKAGNGVVPHVASLSHLQSVYHLWKYKRFKQGGQPLLRRLQMSSANVTDSTDTVDYNEIYANVNATTVLFKGFVDHHPIYTALTEPCPIYTKQTTPTGYTYINTRKKKKITKPHDTYCFLIIPPPVHALLPPIPPTMTILSVNPPLSELSETTATTLSTTSSQQWNEQVLSLKVALQRNREKNS